MLEENASSEDVSSRLTLLLGRRLHLSSSDEEDEEVHSHPSTAAHALRQLLAHKTGYLDNLQHRLGMGGWLSRPGSRGTSPPKLDAAEARSRVGSGQPQGSAEEPPCPHSTPAPGQVLPSQQEVDSPQERSHQQQPSPAAGPLTHSGSSANLQDNAVCEMLRKQAEAEARRQQARAARDLQLQQMQQAYAQQHMAAYRIAKAWKRYQASPARTRRVAAATSVQTAWRGLQARRASAALAERKTLLGQLHEAIDGADRVRVQETMELLVKLGFGADAQQLVAAFEHDATRAAQQLRSAAVKGSAREYQQSLHAAHKYSHLRPAAEEAARVFQARQEAAERALWQAVEERPLVEFKEAASIAAFVGVNPDSLSRAEQTIGVRNERATRELHAAVERVPFEPELFQTARQHAEALGLHADAARAQRGLELRRHRTTQHLQALAEQGSSPQIDAAVVDAQLLGLENAAAVAATRLAQRRTQAARQLAQLVDHATLQVFEAAAGVAADLCVDAAHRQTCQDLFSRRTHAAEAALKQDAAQGTLAAFRRSRAAALGLGLQQAVVEAEEVLQQRRQLAAAGLAGAARGVCTLAAHLKDCCQGQCGECPVSAPSGRSGAAAVLAAHLGIARQLCEAVGVTRAEQGGGTGGTQPRASSRPGAGAPPLGAVAFEELVEQLSRSPSTVHKHSVGGGSRSMRDALLYFAGSALEASRLDLQEPLHIACSAILVQLKVLLSQCTATVVPLVVPPWSPDQGEQCMQHGKQGQQEEGACACAQDIILRQVGAIHRLFGGGAPSWPVLQNQEALVRGFHTWRRRQLDSMSPAALAMLQHTNQPGLVSGATGTHGFTGGSEAEVECITTEGGGSTGLVGVGEPRAGGSGGGSSSSSSRCSSQQWAEMGELHLDVSKQGLESLELLAACTSLRSLDLSTNLLTSLHGLSGLVGLQVLQVADNKLSSLAGIHALSNLTSLVADDNLLSDVSALSGLASLASLASLSMRNNHLSSLDSLACLAPCRHLTMLNLASNRLTGTCALPALPHLAFLDLSGNKLTSLHGLAAGCPLLQTLIASGNPLAAFPADLDSAFLRTLWLADCGLREVASWPWLPSLRELHLHDNALPALPPMYGFCSLRHLNLSFNALDHAGSSVHCMMPLAALRCLQLNDNPVAAGAGYAADVAEALPWLEELDLEAIGEQARHRNLHSACRSGRLPLACLHAPGRPLLSLAAAAGYLQCHSALPSALLPEADVQQAHSVQWEAGGILWALSDWPSAVAAVSQQAALQHISAASTAAFPGGSYAALASLSALPEVADAGAGAAAAAAAGGAGRDRAAVSELAQQYALLLTIEPATQAQSLITISSSYHRRALGTLSRHALVIQTRWRGCHARRVRRQLAEQRLTLHRHMAAVMVQAAWHGWATRRQHAHVVMHLNAWREEWRQRQELLELHQRHCAAAQLQAAWRGHRVRLLLGQARAAARLQPHSTSSTVDPELSCSSLDDILGGCDGALPSITAPERLGLEAEPDGCTLPLPCAPPTIWSAAAAASGTGLLMPQPLGKPATMLPAGQLGMLASLPASPAPLSTQPSSLGAVKLPVLSPGASAALIAAGHVEGPTTAGNSCSAGTVKLDQCPSYHLPSLQPTSPSVPQLAAAVGQCYSTHMSMAGTSSGQPQDGHEEPSCEWAFKDEATAAAYLQLRKKQAQQAQRREVREHMKDPVARLQLFRQQNRGGRSRGSTPPPHHAAATSQASCPHPVGPTSHNQQQQQCSYGSTTSSPLQSLLVSAALQATSKAELPKAQGDSGASRRPVLLQTLFPFEF